MRRRTVYSLVGIAIITLLAILIVGFATTLFIGVLISMLTAILVSRTFLRLVLAGARPTHRTFFGADL